MINMLMFDLLKSKLFIESMTFGPEAIAANPDPVNIPVPGPVDSRFDQFMSNTLPAISLIDDHTTDFCHWIRFHPQTHEYMDPSHRKGSVVCDKNPVIGMIQQLY